MVRCALLAVATISAAALGAPPAGAEVRIGFSAPFTGRYAWVAAEPQAAAQLALADLNAADGVLGEHVEMISVDDYCAADQAIAAAEKLIETRVVAAIGPMCSSAALSASEIFANAGILMISPLATTPKLTEQGFDSVFRAIGRDDVQGKLAGDFLAERWPDKTIAIVHDGSTYGEALAEETKKRLNEHGVSEAVFDVVEPGEVDYVHIVQQMQDMHVDVLYYGGYAPEAALILRQLREKGSALQFVSGDGIGVEDFALVAGSASEGAFFTRGHDPTERPEAKALATRLGRLSAGAFRTYAAVQVWAQAAEKARTFKTDAVANALRIGEFDTVIGRIGFDEKGDVTGASTFFWYVWRGGYHAPLEDEPAITE
jgi:branched-chain amino acid transport system substrate-binding protein